MIKAIINWWNTLIKEEFELTVWFDGGTREDAEGDQRRVCHRANLQGKGP